MIMFLVFVVLPHGEGWLAENTFSGMKRTLSAQNLDVNSEQKQCQHETIITSKKKVKSWLLGEVRWFYWFC